MKQLTLLLAVMLLVLGACRLEELFPTQKTCEPNTFERIYNQESNYGAYEIATVDNNTFMISGTTKDLGQVFFMQIDTLGNETSYQRNIATNISVRTMLPTNEGQFIICGAQNAKAYLALYDAQGIFITSADDINSDASACRDIVLADNGTYIFVGNRGDVNDTAATKDDIYVGQAKISSNSIEVIKEYLPSKQSGKQSTSVISLESDGELLIGGYWEDQDEWQTYFLEMDDTLRVIDEKRISYAPDFEIFLEDMIPIPGDGHLVIGYLRDNSDADAPLEMMSFRVNGSGTIQGNLTRYSDENLNSRGYTLIPAVESGKYILTGYRETSQDQDAGYLIKIDDNGNINWENTYNTPPNNSYLFATAIHSGSCSDSYISVGYSLEGGNRKVFVVKTDTEGVVE